MRVLSLFSGIGGFDLGFKRAGMDIIGMCEIDSHAQKVLKKHFPDVVLHSDVREVEYERGTVDVLCGGFPCQDVSRAGQRKGLAGERSGLWFEFSRVIDTTLPKWVVIENVEGLLSSNNGGDFATIIYSLAERGYGVGWRVLDSQGFGLAQRRKRVFIIASLGSPSGCTVLLESAGLSWSDSEGTEAWKDDSRALEKFFGRSRGNNYKIIQPISKEVHTQVLWVASHTDEPARISSDPELSPTLTARSGTGGNNMPLIGVRRMTPTEFERLQGFPDGWTAGQSDTQRYKQLGNAVSVPVAEWIGKRIMEKEYGK